MRHGRCAVALRICCIMALFLFSSHAFAAGIDCQKCHSKLTKGTTLHAAVSMGCTTCHSGIDAKTVPHKKQKGAAGRGLSAEQPELCYGCHDKKAFEKKHIHAALGMGCTSCHNPHSSNTPKLLIAEAPDLCFTCHDKSLFSKKFAHSPVAGGMCLTCHVPHSSDEVALLANSPYDLCLTCHSEIAKLPHAIARFALSEDTHPVGPIMKISLGKKKRKKMSKDLAQDLASAPTKTFRILMDPTRPDRQFYCGSCHDPHSTESFKLIRFKAKDAFDTCKNCHKDF